MILSIEILFVNRTNIYLPLSTNSLLYFDLNNFVKLLQRDKFSLK